MGNKNSTAWVTFNLVVIFFMGGKTIICGKIFTFVVVQMCRCIFKHILDNKG